MNLVKVALFEDHLQYRNTLCLLLSHAEGIELTGCYADAIKLDEAFLKNPPQVVLMDIDLPGRNGIDAAMEIKMRFPATEIIMLTIFDQDDKIFRAIQKCASGYLLKKASSEEILDAIQAVLQGGSPMTPSVARRVIEYFKAAPKESSYELTPRELEIIHAVVDGNSYKMIAAQLFISTNTVRNHLRNIYEKLQVHSKSEVVARALKEGWMK